MPSDLVSEFERELSELHARYEDRPEEELIQLLLVAMERERMVSVSYREDVLGPRIDQLPLGEDARRILRHALVWIWKDEEMHAIFSRGALMRRAGVWRRLETRCREIAGFIAGWATSVTHHLPWRVAPLSRFAASMVTWLGRLSGKVTAAIRPHLRYSTFREFCRFNIDAEVTAGRGWRRAIELAPSVPELPSGWAAAFARMEIEEQKHCEIFQRIFAGLDPTDRLRPDMTVESLATKIGEVGEYFLPRPLRRAPERDNPIGLGGTVHVITGDSIEAAVDEALEAVNLAEILKDRRRGAAGATVAVKTTFMLGTTRRDTSPVIDPRFLSRLAQRLRGLGCARVVVLEAPNLYDRFFSGRSVLEVARHFGLEDPAYEVVDLAADQVPHTYARGLGHSSISKTWKEADLRISLARMRSHPSEHVYLNLGTLEGLGTPGDYLFRERLANRESVLMMTMGDFPPDLALIDAFEGVADGILGVMGCARPKSPRRIYVGRDALSVDTVAARHMGLMDPNRSPLLEAAGHWFGGVGGPIEVRGIDESISDWRGPWDSDFSTLLSLIALPVYEHLSGEGELFVAEMDEEAFGELRPSGPVLRFTRGMLRALLGLRLPRS